MKAPPPRLLNDIHSQLNETRVESLHYPTSTEEISQLVKRAKRLNKSISLSGSRHAMGSQQFGTGTMHLSMSKMNAVIELDRQSGIVRVEAGIEWAQLVPELLEMQKDSPSVWSIRQKQSGADNLSIGGTVSANAHGRGIKLKPIVADIEALTLVNADGEVLKLSREKNSELFRLVIGGYGLFGVIATVDLRLMPRTKLKRVVEIVDISELSGKLQQRIDEGFSYADFQYKTDNKA